MLFSLRDILEQANPDWMKTRITYLEFLKDPWQKKSSEQQKETEQTKEFHSMVKFIEMTEQIIDNKDKGKPSPKKEKRTKFLQEQCNNMTHLQQLVRRVDLSPEHSL